uniref:C-type lectin domain-containing protein n=1 Tax=Stegastes partitus TaxID=144197 RepID=A0A3B4Z363_9TELE
LCSEFIVRFDLSGTSSSQRCPPDWREIQSKCYFLSTEMKTWEDSRKYCQRNGSDLVVINSQQEQVLCSSSALVDMYLLFWIGLKGTNRVFRWVDGSALKDHTKFPDCFVGCKNVLFIFWSYFEEKENKTSHWYLH